MNEPIGVSPLSKQEDRRSIENRQSIIMRNVKKIINKHGLDGEEWAQAVSSQYFLICLADRMKIKNRGYKELLNTSLGCYDVTYDDKVVLDPKKLLITPKETAQIVESMRREDENDDYFKRYKRMSAENINAEQMYFNFHHGLQVRMASSEKTDVLKKIAKLSLDVLTDENAIDTAGGWYPYRVPWITARILISLKHISYDDYEGKEQLDCIIEEAIDSLFARIDEKDGYWRSGVGTWVSKWESTALCLEAIHEWDSIEANKARIDNVISYLTQKSIFEEWISGLEGFDTEDKANSSLATVILASVLYRVLRKHYNEEFQNYRNRLLNLFDEAVNMISSKGKKACQQYCTIPQVLYYVVEAIYLDMNSEA